MLAASLPRLALAQCDGRPIRRVTVVTEGLFTDQDTRIPGFLQGIGSALHTTTREHTVRNDLLFAPGDPCDPQRLAETQRLLFARPYLRGAQVTPFAMAGDSVDVEVRTQDEWSLRGGIAYDATALHPLRRLRLAEENVAGRGLHLQAEFIDVGREPGFDAGLISRQFLGAHTLELLGGNSGVGPLAEQSVQRPFNSEFDRTAWREGTRYLKEPFQLANPVLGSIVQPTVDAGADLGVARRFGRPGRLLLVGSVLSYERLFTNGLALAAVPANDSAAEALLAGRYTERRRVRAHLLLGARTLRFVRRRGVDAVNASEDIRLGFEGGLIGGISLFGGDGLQHDRFAAGELYAGAEPGRGWLMFLRSKWEGRWLEQGGGAGAWDGVIASGDLVLYRLSGPHTTWVLGASAAGGWHTSTPFQLTLSGSNGVRGYRDALPVAQRAVVRLERRSFRGVLFGAIDVGTVWFADVGQGWAGDAPFGMNTGVIGAAGAGLRLAFPHGSRLTYRIDVAVPSDGHGIELRTGFGQQLGWSRGEAGDVARSREHVSSTTVFNFPRF